MWCLEGELCRFRVLLSVPLPLGRLMISVLLACLPAREAGSLLTMVGLLWTQDV